MTDQDTRPEPGTKDRFVRIHEVLSRLGIGKNSLYDMIENGDFEEPIILRRNIHCWLESDVDKYIARKAKEARRGSRTFLANHSED